ncbi:MAG: class I SAM-dependent methyltransferase [Verrucomicrobia bacterium]|nr:class I SAM-dependent methyltransferase [Verrucomicrobiota bacterium]
MNRPAFYREDLAYIHHVGFGELATRAAPELLRILKRAGIRRGTLVDLGCGSGLWAKAAERAGFDVIGVDCSPDMIRLAKRVAPRARYRCASLHEFELPPCDAITILGEGLNYLDGEQIPKVEKLFKRAAQTLRPDGFFIFDVMIREGPAMNYRGWRAGKDWAALFEAAENRRKHVLTRRITAFRKIGSAYRRSEETHVVRLFDHEEVTRALRASGFSVRVSRRYGRTPLAPRRMAFFALNGSASHG